MMSADDGIHIKQTEKGFFEVRYWMGDHGEGSLLGTKPSLDEAIKLGQGIGPTEYGFTFSWVQNEFQTGERCRINNCPRERKLLAEIHLLREASNG
jgi:hypothetical protein